MLLTIQHWAERQTLLLINLNKFCPQSLPTEVSHTITPPFGLKRGLKSLLKETHKVHLVCTKNYLKVFETRTNWFRLKGTADNTSVSSMSRNDCWYCFVSTMSHTVNQLIKNHSSAIRLHIPSPFHLCEMCGPVLVLEGTKLFFFIYACNPTACTVYIALLSIAGPLIKSTLYIQLVSYSNTLKADIVFRILHIITRKHTIVMVCCLF